MHKEQRSWAFVVAIVVSLAVFLGGCFSRKERAFVFESGGINAEVLINGSHAGWTPLTLTTEQMSRYFVSDLEEVTSSVAAMTAAIDASNARIGLFRSVKIERDLTWSLYPDEPGADPSTPVDYVLAYRGEGSTPNRGEILSGGLRVRVQTADGLELLKIDGVTTGRRRTGSDLWHATLIFGERPEEWEASWR